MEGNGAMTSTTTWCAHPACSRAMSRNGSRAWRAPATSLTKRRRGACALSDEHAYFLASDGSEPLRRRHVRDRAGALVASRPRSPKLSRKAAALPSRSSGPECVTALDLINRGVYRAPLHGLLAEVAARRGGEAPGRRQLLDVGCGSGRVCVAFAKAFPKAAILASIPMNFPSRRRGKPPRDWE